MTFSGEYRLSKNIVLSKILRGRGKGEEGLSGGLPLLFTNKKKNYNLKVLT